MQSVGGTGKHKRPAGVDVSSEPAYQGHVQAPVVPLVGVVRALADVEPLGVFKRKYFNKVLNYNKIDYYIILKMKQLKLLLKFNLHLFFFVPETVGTSYKQGLLRFRCCPPIPGLRGASSASTPAQKQAFQR